MQKNNNISKMNKDILDYQNENYVRKSKDLYLNIYQNKPQGFIAVADGLAKDEIESLNKIIEFLDAPGLTDLFPKDIQITEKTNVRQLCVDSRKKCLEAVADQFTKFALAENITYPKMRLDELFNVVENFYDSFYLRHSKDKDLDLFLGTNKGDLNKLRIKAAKALKGNVGIEGIKKDFATKKKMTFAKYCLEKTKKHVVGLNNAVRNYCAIQNLEVPDKIDADYNNVNRDKISQVKNTVPTYLHMLNQSYKSRSTLERFFSYFPFINRAAKEERISINRIEDMLKNVSYLKMTSQEIESATKKCASDNGKKYYEVLLKQSGYKPEAGKIEVEKEKVIVEEANTEKVVEIARAKKNSDIELQRRAVNKLIE
jgi:hypothetical protein